MDLLEAAAATGGTALHGNPSFTGVSTDSRSVGTGDLFVALTGENFDGHDYVAAAFERGAAAAVVRRGWAGVSQRALLEVDAPLAALGALAANWRARFDLPLIGVTGSNGKTTVKEMCAAILRARMAEQGLDPLIAVLATQGNLNNDIGLPLMLLRMRPNHCSAVIEMGMNHPGEIAYLTGLARPTVAVVTNAQRAHLEGMGGLAAVAEEKGAIYGGLGESGIAVVNADDPFADYWRGINGDRCCISFGLGHPADVAGSCTPHGLQSLLRLRSWAGDAEIRLQVPGLHNARNAVAAAAATLAAGASLDAVCAGLEAYRGVKGRLHVRAAQSGATLIDDSYNANPDSVRAAIDVLAATPGKTILVFGDMGEIGERAGQLHDEIGGYAKSAGIDRLYAIGDHAALAASNFGVGGHHFQKVDSLVAALVRELTKDTVVLVKGSRFMRMERVADALAAPDDKDNHAA
ncbi:MAG: UDP-N-acetylmuramoyl-tripeptide--D-alanyl-D-alanine ligase [Rhodocyclaceae bacterium]